MRSVAKHAHPLGDRIPAAPLNVMTTVHVPDVPDVYVPAVAPPAVAETAHPLVVNFVPCVIGMKALWDEGAGLCAHDDDEHAAASSAMISFDFSIPISYFRMPELLLIAVAARACPAGVKWMPSGV